MKWMLPLMLFCLLMHPYGCAKQKGSESIRIISLSPHITEILFTLNAGNDLIAVTDFCKYPPQADTLPKIGGLLNPNIEKMVELRPTHLFGVPAHSDLAVSLTRFDLDVTMMPNEKIKDMLESIHHIGSAIGKEREARVFIQSFHDSIAVLQADIPADSQTAVLVIGREPGLLRNIMVAGPSTFISELWNICGGINLFKDLSNRYGTISIESILERNPDVVIELKSGEADGIKRVKSNSPWLTLESVNAIRHSHIFEISGNYTMIPGPRMLLLANDFMQIRRQIEREKRLYPDIYR